jgi:hypothetical protein
MTEVELKEMKLHEQKQLGDVTITRVYKGWIYTFENKRFCSGVGYQIVMSSVFVPWS